MTQKRLIRRKLKQLINQPLHKNQKKKKEVKRKKICLYYKNNKAYSIYTEC